MKGKTQVKVRMDTDLKDQLAALADLRGYSVSELVEQGVRTLLNPQDDYQVVSRNYLADMALSHRRQLKRVELIEEALGQFVFLYFFYTPEMVDNDNRKVMMSSARKRFDGFLKRIAKRGAHFRNAFEEVLVADTDFNIHETSSKNEGASDEG